MIQEEAYAVDRLYSDFTRILERIEDTEISLRNSVEEIFQKSLYVAIGSHFEQQITHYILEFMGKSSNNNVLVTEFVRNKAIARQYHTLFVWKDNNANAFFGLFGQDFRAYMTGYVRENPEYAEAIRAFLEVGNVRNEVAHNFESVTFEKTADEIYSRYKEALAFVEHIPSHFEAFLASRRSTGSE